MTFDDWLTLSADLPDDEARHAWLHDHRDQLSVQLLQMAKTRSEEIGYGGDLEGGLQIIADAFPIAVALEGLEDLLGEALLWRAWANVLQFHERYEDSLIISQNAVEVYECYIAIARTVEVGALGALERFDEAIALAHWIRPYFERQSFKRGFKLGLARLASALGRVYVAAWRLEEALPEYKLARQLYLELGLLRDAAWVLHNLGHQALRLDDLDLADSLLTQAYGELIAVSDLVSAVKAQFNLARVKVRQGGFEEALQHIAQAREHLEQLKRKNQPGKKTEDLPDEGYVNLLEANIRYHLHDYPTAEALLREALALFERLGRRLEAAETLVELARLLMTRGTPAQQAESMECLEKARKLLDDLPVSLFNAWVQLEQGELLLRQGDIAELGALAEQAATIFQTAKLRLRQAQAVALWADYLVKRQPNEARRLYEEALTLIGHGAPLLAIRCWYGLGLATTDMAAAEAYYIHAIKLLEELRRALRSHYQQAGFLEDKQTIHEELLTAVQDQPDKIAYLLNWIEHFKASVLADLLLFQPPDRSVDETLRQVLEERERLSLLLDQHLSALQKGNVDSMESPIQRGPAFAAHDEHQSEMIASLRRQLRTIEEKINRQLDPTTAWRVATPIQAEEIHSLLDEQTILIAYYTTRNGQLAAMTVGHELGDLRVHSLHVPLAEIMRKWESYRNHLTDVARARARLAFFYDRLIRPLEQRLRHKSRLLILPHRHLFHIPFSALYDKREGSYLLERWMVQLAPSATILAWCQKQQTQSQLALLVGYPGRPGQWDFLPGVKQEIEMLTKLLPALRTLFGPEATEASVLKQMPGNHIVHLAGHAYYDAQYPLESGMPLAGGGWLRAADLYMRYGLLNGAMVVLSGCQTGKGQPTGGEVLGLLSAFLYAGAQAVVSSLWHVADKQTPPLMSQFYQGLLSGLETAEALRQAQLYMLSDETYAAPYYWAAFQLTGASRVFDFLDK